MPATPMSPRRRLLAALAAAPAAALLPACATVDGPGSGPARMKLSGSVVHRDRSALPPDAVVVVGLYDLAGREDKAVAETRVPVEGRQVPIPFVLEFDPARGDPTQPYQVRAQILAGGTTRFVTGTRVTVRPSDPPVSLSILVVPGSVEPNFGQTSLPSRGGPPPRPAPRQPAIPKLPGSGSK